MKGWSRKKNVYYFRIKELSKVIKSTSRRKSIEKDKVLEKEKC